MRKVDQPTPEMSMQEPAASLFGDADIQMALSISALLPWLCAHHKQSQIQDVAAACIQVPPRLSLEVQRHYMVGEMS